MAHAKGHTTRKSTKATFGRSRTKAAQEFKSSGKKKKQKR